MTRFHKLDIKCTYNVEPFKEYLLRNVKVATLACCVCGNTPWDYTRRVLPQLSERHTANVGEYYYVIPSWHEECIEMFHLNPLPYTDPL